MLEKMVKIENYKKSIGKKVVLACFSDIGYENAIGRRPYEVFNNISGEDKYLILRAVSADEKREGVLAFNFLRKLDRILLGMSVYIFNPITTRFGFKIHFVRISHYFFEKYVIRCLKRIGVSDVGVFHSWNYMPRVFKFLKENGNDVKIVVDMPMTFSNVLKDIKDKHYWPAANFSAPDNFYESRGLVDHYVVPSGFTAKSLYLEDVEVNDVSVVPFGVDLGKFKGKKKRRGKSAENFICTFCGNVNNRKGIPYLIEAWKELDLKNAELNLCGRVYPEVKHLLYDAEKYGIKIRGYVNSFDIMPKSDVYVFPSLLEGSSKSIYEAMASELAVITTENSGSIVTNGKDGFIIDIESVEEIKEKILFLYENRSKMERMGKTGRKNVMKYTWDRYAEEVIKVYGR